MSVNVENLSVAYRSRRGDVTAVDNVSFTLADGEIMGLAGESGMRLPFELRRPITRRHQDGDFGQPGR